MCYGGFNELVMRVEWIIYFDLFFDVVWEEDVKVGELFVLVWFLMELLFKIFFELFVYGNNFNISFIIVRFFFFRYNLC